MTKLEALDRAIRRVPNFPKPGVLFYDITGILITPGVFSYCINEMTAACKKEKIDAVAGIEARGFVFAAPIAVKLGVPLILIRKKGKLPGKTFSCRYALEYGMAEIEVHSGDVTAGQRVMLLDDLIATGGTLKAARSVLEEAGATVAGFMGAVGLPFLEYDKALSPTPVTVLITYDSE
jgi:adenine phosphoribosyltransferase